MTRIEGYAKPSSLDGALAAKAADPGSAYLAGGTYLLAGYAGGRTASPSGNWPLSVIDLGGILPRGIKLEGGELVIGAGATFQDLADSALVPAILCDAALRMANRNTRNRATLGGNLGANKSCASLIPALLVLEAELAVAGAGAHRMPVAAWLASPAGIILAAGLRPEPARLAAYGRWGRTACDVSVLTAAVSYRYAGTAGGAAAGDAIGRPLAGLKIALGGLGPKARRYPELEAIFEGGLLPPKDTIEKAAAPLLGAIDDRRASAAFKRLRAASLLADCMHAARAEVEL